MKLDNPRFLASACLVALLAAPAGVLARDGKDKKHVSVPEPSTLVMTIAGIGLGMGLIVLGLRRKRASNAA
jgi:hypothetical protein